MEHLSTRLNFPDGLKVLLIEQPLTGSQSEALLKQLKYDVTQAQDVQQAVAQLHASKDAFSDAAPGLLQAISGFDVVLADAAAVGSLNGAEARQLFNAAGRVPLVLMGEKCSPIEIMAAVQQGCADFLEKPLSQLKLRNIWQHTVRMLMGNSPSSSQPESAQNSPKAAAAATAAASTQKQTLECDIALAAQQLEAAAAAATHPLVDDCAAIDGLTGLELPPLVPSQLTFDPDMIFLDLDCPVRTDEPSLDDILQPCGPALAGAESDSMAAGDTELRAAGCSSEQNGCSSGATTAFPGTELESCADTISSRLASSGTAAAGLRSHASMRSLAGCTSEQQPAATAATCAAEAATPAGGAAAQAGDKFPMPVAGCPVYPPLHMGTSGPFWGAPTGTRGMVWGMPVHTLATVPGIVPNGSTGKCSTPKSGSTNAGSKPKDADSSEQAAAAAKDKLAVASSGSGASAVPAVPGLPAAMCWPPMPMMMPPAATVASQARMPAAGMCGMFPGMPMFPGVQMFSGMQMQMQQQYSALAGGMPMPAAPGMGMGMPAPYMGMGMMSPCMWQPAAAPAAAGISPSAAAAVPSAGCAAGKAAGGGDVAAGPDSSTRSRDAAAAAAAAATAPSAMCSSGSMASSSLASSECFSPSLYIGEPKTGCSGLLATDLLFGGPGSNDGMVF